MKPRQSIVAALLVLALPSFAAEPSLAEAYRVAKAALEGGDAAKCIEILAPALQAAAREEERAPAQLALGIAYLRTGAAEGAVSLLQQAAGRFAGTPDSANALAPLGDALRRTGQANAAERAYRQAVEDSPQTVNGRYAKARLAELGGERLEEEKLFPEAALEYLAAGDALLALGSEDAAYFADARALYEKVAKGPDPAVTKGKTWRGEPTARAVFSLGEVERAQQRYPEAIAFYQRTFVSWVKYPQWPARAYLRAAECMDKLGKRDFAIRHLRELVRKVEKYGKLPEYEQAKKQLRAWGEDVR